MDIELLDGICRKIDECGFNLFSNHEEYPLFALVNLLGMLNLFRAEGIALLGEHLALNLAFGCASDSMKIFLGAFLVTLKRSSVWASGCDASDAFVDQLVRQSAYESSPMVLLKIMYRRGDIDGEVYQQIKKGLETGNYKQDEAMVIEVLRQSLSFGIPKYIQGLLSLGDEVAPMRLLLAICGQIQDDFDEDNINGFVKLVQSPNSAEAYVNSIKSIMGCVYTERELDIKYSEFKQKPIDVRAYPQLKEKISTLYSTMKTSAISQKKAIAQWALTYFFDDQDLIHDNVPGLGFVDDMIVIDNSLSVLDTYQAK